MSYRTKPRRTPAEIATDRLSRLASEVTPWRMARATRDTLDALVRLRGGQDHAMQLRTMLAAGLADAIERADTAPEMRRQQAQEMVPGLRAGMEAVDGWMGERG